jgi:hypothetical protein
LALLVDNKRDSVAVESSTSVRSNAEARHIQVISNALDSEALATNSAAVTAATAFALDRFAEKFPHIQTSFAGRFLEMAAVGGLLVPKTVLEHELGHADAVENLGGEVKEVKLTGWASGFTSWNINDDKEGRKRSIVAAAGLNQETETANYMYKDWAKRGSTDYQEAMAYLLAQSNLGLYAARTLARGDNTPSSDDIAQYVELMQQRGHKISQGQLLAMSAVADLASAPMWAALKGQYDFLLKGERKIDMPSFKIGETQFAYPNMQAYLGADGPVLGGTIIVDPDKKHPIELSAHTRYDATAQAIGAKIYDLALSDGMSVNPYLRVTRDEVNVPGIAVGSELRYTVYESDKLAVDMLGQVEFSHNDLLQDIKRKQDGLNAYVGFQVHF